MKLLVIPVLLLSACQFSGSGSYTSVVDARTNGKVFMKDSVDFERKFPVVDSCTLKYKIVDGKKMESITFLLVHHEQDTTQLKPLADRFAAYIKKDPYYGGQKHFTVQLSEGGKIVEYLHE